MINFIKKIEIFLIIGYFLFIDYREMDLLEKLISINIVIEMITKESFPSGRFIK